ncbi:TPA: hypothetical protein ACG0AR_003634, partial [Elizabethkingia anophelis]
NKFIDIELNECCFGKFNYFNNKYSHRIVIFESKITNSFNIKESYLKYIYLEKFFIGESWEIINTNISFEGIVCKNVQAEGVHFSGNCNIRSLRILDKSIFESFSFTSCKIRSFNIENSLTKYVYSFSNDFDEFLMTNCEIENINIASSKIDVVLFQNSLDIKNIEIKKTELKELSIINNIKIESLLVKESIVLFFNIYKDVFIKNFETDKESTLGDFDISESTIRYFDIKRQTNSYNIKNSELSLFKLNSCDINLLNFSNGCKVEAYISECNIDRVVFKQTLITKDTLISFSSCKMYSLIMDNFSVIGNLYLRNIMPLENPLNKEWSDINKYKIYFNKDEIDYELIEFILSEIK